MKGLSSRINSWGVCRFILYSGFSFVFICMIVYPSVVTLALQTSPTETAQPSPSSGSSGTPTVMLEEVQGQVGANAGLVCGAVILVIIIIGGLMRGARWMPYRGHDTKGEGE